MRKDERPAAPVEAAPAEAAPRAEGSPSAAAVAVPAIELKAVNAFSAGYQVLSELSVAFPERRTSVVMGGTGSGKSALLKAAAGLLQPGSGSVEFRSVDMARFSRKDEAEFRAKSGFVFQDAALWSDTTILGNVSMPLSLHKPWMGKSDAAEAVRLILKRLGYEGGMAMRPADLSSGEQKMASIARAVVHDPDIVFMDDPAVGLDEDATEQLFELIDELESRGKTLIIVTNASEFAYRFADMLGIIRDGRLVAFGPYEETLARAEREPELRLERLKARGIRAARKRRESL